MYHTAFYIYSLDSLSTATINIELWLVLPSVAVHVYVPASEAPSWLNVSMLRLLVISTPDVIWLFMGSSQVIVG